MDTTQLVVRCDGLAAPRNPGGVATYAWVAYLEDGTTWTGESFGVAAVGANATNNVAEYAAVIDALKTLRACVPNGWTGPPEELRIETDSQLVVRQLNGQYAVNSPRLFPLVQKVRALVKSYAKVVFHWIPREQNKAADLLSRIAYVKYWRQRGKESPACQFLTRAELDEAEKALGPVSEPGRTTLPMEGADVEEKV